ncbi:flavin-containing amine oxidoreductase [Leptodontidium sp. 2 PMI_412]|nr:flavin-containing amine oxidoreductase [Leptodontidium sp. 2 PMI_412]
MFSKDGFEWTKSQGLRAGIPSIGVIQPSSNITNSDSESVFDVIVIGGGYCGLTAARDASMNGLRVLLLEARDRIGGRSWSSNIDRYPFELGGTWVHWGQPCVWREIARYQMRDQLKDSFDYSKGLNEHHMKHSGGLSTMSHEEEDAIAESGLAKVTNVDGDNGRKIMPFAHNASYYPEVVKYDNMTVADRIAEIRDTLTLQEVTSVTAFVLLCSGGTLETTSFFEFLHWWALSGYTYRGCVEYLIKYKFGGGQSSFAIKFFQEALSTTRLKYAFNSPISAITDHGNSVQATTRNGKTYQAARLICTIPLNVLNTIAFSPPLNAKKQAAADTGHVNQCIKVHAEIRDPNMRSWTAVNNTGNGLVYGFGDGTTPAGNTHVVCFGAQQNHFEPDDSIDQTFSALKGLAPMDIERVVFHHWSKDEFAKGAWFFPAPSFLSKYLESLRERQGNIFFASSDWALGWRSFIDGAIEDGTRAALAVKLDLSTPPVSHL